MARAPSQPHAFERTNAPTARRALGRLPTGHMNKTEAAYAGRLELRKAAGEILGYDFEALKFRLADNTFYTPDFAVMLSTQELQAHEVKGFWEDDARVKIKMAARLFPIQFVAVFAPRRKADDWAFEEF